MRNPKDITVWQVYKAQPLIHADAEEEIRQMLSRLKVGRIKITNRTLLFNNDWWLKFYTAQVRSDGSNLLKAIWLDSSSILPVEQALTAANNPPLPSFFSLLLPYHYALLAVSPGVCGTDDFGKVNPA
ncbi:hypothetical protein NBRC10512v2_006327 [Rhodotorula toruloides]